MSAGINGTSERIMSWALWLSWDLQRQMDEWKRSLERERFHLKHDAEMRKRYGKGWRPVGERAVATPRDEYGHKSAGR